MRTHSIFYDLSFRNIFKPQLETDLQGSNENFSQSSPHPSSKHTKNLFSPQEDNIIIDHVRRYGPKKWKICAQRLDRRTARQCCERFNNFLDPSISHSEWSIEEDIQLEEYVKKMGHQWSTICKFFEHRTPVSLKSRYKTNAHRYIIHQSELQKTQKKVIFPSMQNYLDDNIDYSIDTFLKNMNDISNFSLKSLPDFHLSLSPFL